MNKKLIITISAAGLISFAAAYSVGRFTKKVPVQYPHEPNQPAAAAQQDQPPTGSGVQTASLFNTADDRYKKITMTEKQLKDLVYEVRAKIQEYDNKLESLESQQRRLQIAQQTLNEDVENLNNLRVELATMTAGLKEQRDKLLKSRIEIDQKEKTNLAKIAATYDKMEAGSAGKILSNMCTGRAQSTGSAQGAGNIDDAVKILHYMTERTKANVLAELVASEPGLAAALCERLKRIVVE